jgi:hypothetical protein
MVRDQTPFFTVGFLYIEQSSGTVQSRLRRISDLVNDYSEGQ